MTSVGGVGPGPPAARQNACHLCPSPISQRSAHHLVSPPSCPLLVPFSPACPTARRTAELLTELLPLTGGGGPPEGLSGSGTKPFDCDDCRPRASGSRCFERPPAQGFLCPPLRRRIRPRPGSGPDRRGRAANQRRVPSLRPVAAGVPCDVAMYVPTGDVASQPVEYRTLFPFVNSHAPPRVPQACVLHSLVFAASYSAPLTTPRWDHACRTRHSGQDPCRPACGKNLYQLIPRWPAPA